MEPCMIDIFLTESGIIQMYLNSIIYIDLSSNLEDDFNILCKSMRHHSIYTKNEKVYYNNNSNSFSDFVQSITGLTVKSISPRTIKILNKKFKKNKIAIDNYKKNRKLYNFKFNKFINANKNLYKNSMLRNIITI